MRELNSASRESKFSTRGLGCSNCEENKSKAERLVEDLQKKELKWTAAINKLKESLLQAGFSTGEFEDSSEELLAPARLCHKEPACVHSLHYAGSLLYKGTYI